MRLTPNQHYALAQLGKWRGDGPVTAAFLGCKKTHLDALVSKGAALEADPPEDTLPLIRTSWYRITEAGRDWLERHPDTPPAPVEAWRPKRKNRVSKLWASKRGG